MFVPNYKLSFGPDSAGNTYSFEYVTDISMRSSWKDLTQTCHIKLPRNVGNYGTGRLDTLIYRGMAVSVAFGYDGAYDFTFNGFISKIMPTIPVEIMCEDNMFKYKTLVVAPKSFVQPTVKQILDYCNVSSVMPYTTLGDITITDFLIDKKMGTAARVLQSLIVDLKLYSFIRTVNGVETLIVGQPYDDTGNAPQVNFAFGENIEDFGNLTYMDEADIRILLEAVSKRNAGKDLKVEVGDSDGDKRTRYYFNVPDVATLTQMANRDIAYYKYGGYRGDFKAFGIPKVNHGDIVNLSDADFSDRNGSYYVDAVWTTGGDGGIRQKIELGPLADSVYKFTTN